MSLLQKRPKHALTASLKAQHFGDGSAQINFNLGAAYLALTVYEDVKIYFEKALSINPKLVAAYIIKVWPRIH